MHRLLRRVFTQPVRAAAAGRFTPAVAQLEDRTVPATFNVTTNADTGTGSLRDAISQANTAAGQDTITFAASVTGTITLASKLSITEAVNITGPGASVLSVSGNNLVQVFDTTGTATGTTTATAINISGLTITAGKSTGDGGAILMNDEFVNLTNVVVSNSSTGATSQGGGIFVAAVGFLQLTECTVSGNTATEDGGGIYFFSGGSLNVVRSTISGNTSGTGSGGGGVYFWGTAAAAPPAGFTASALTFTNSTVSGNTAAAVGAGLAMLNFTGTLALRDSTVTGNTSTGAGAAGIYLYDGLSMTNSVVSGNTGAAYPDIYSYYDITANNSFIGNQTGLTITGAGNLSGNALLGPLANNGGPTLTHLPQTGSPLINAGSNTLVPAGVTTDQRGTGFNRVFGTNVDIGAVEVAPTTVTITSFVRTAAGPVNTPATFTLTFSGAVTGLSSSNFTVTTTGTVAGAQVTSVTANATNTVYTVTVNNYTGQGTVLPVLANTTGVNAPGIGSAVPFPAASSTAVDRVAPTATFTTAVTSPTSAATVAFAVTLSEATAAPLTAANFTAGPSGAPTVAGSGTSYTVTYAFPAGYTGAFTPGLAGAAADAAGNALVVAPPVPAVTVDRAAPTVASVTRVGPQNTNAATVQFLVTFSEPVNGPTSAANYTVSPGTLGGTPAITAISGANGTATRTVTVSTGTGDGRLRLDFTAPAGVADAAGNALSLPAAVTGEDYVVVRSPAILSITATSPTPTNAATATYVVTFNQPVSGVTKDNFAVVTVSGTAGQTGDLNVVTADAGLTYTVTVPGLTGTGVLRLDFTNGTGTTPTVVPIAGVTTLPATGTPVTVDRDAPAVTGLARTGPATTTAATVAYSLTFGEAVAGLTAANFTATQGADPAAVTVAGSGTTYTVTVATNPTDGTLTLTLANLSGVTDAIGNPATGAPRAAEPTQVFRVPPQVLSIGLADASPTSADTVRFVVKFSQPVSGVTAANFALAATVAGARLTGFDPTPGDASVYTITAATGSGNGTLGLSLVNPAGITDQFGRTVTNTASGPAYLVRKSFVTATGIELLGPTLTNASRGTYVVRFTEAVNGFDATDIRVTGATGASVVGVVPYDDGSAGAAYLFEVNYGATDGTLRVSLVDDDTITSAVTGGALAGPADGGIQGVVVTVDRTAPQAKVSLAPGQAATVASGTVQFALNYSEAVTGVADNLQITANGVTYSNFTVAGSGASYTVTFNNVAGRGTLTLNGAAGVDAVGNTSPPTGGATVTLTPPPVVPPPPPPPPPAVAPTAANDAVTTPFGKPASGNVLANDTGAGLTAALVSGPTAAQGSLRFGADGAFTFTPAFNFNGAATFTYQARSSNGLSSQPATVTVTVTGRTHFLAVGAGEGGGPVATLYNPDGSARRSFFAYEDTFRGGVRVATGDVTGDGIDDVVASPGRGGGPRVRVFDGVTGAIVYDFYAYAPDFTGGVYVAVADVDGDGLADVVTTPGLGGGPHVQVFSGKTGESIRSFFAYVPEYRGGIHVAAGDLNGDGFADVVVGAENGGPHVQAFDGRNGDQVRNFFAFDPTSQGGVTVSVADFNGDGKADIVTGSGADARTRIYDGQAPTLLAEQTLNIPNVLGGVRVAAKDTSGDNIADVLAVAPAGGAAPVLRRFTVANGLKPLADTTPFGDGFNGGLYVGRRRTSSEPRA